MNCNNFLFQFLIAIQIAIVTGIGIGSGMIGSTNCKKLIHPGCIGCPEDCARQCPNSFRNGKCLQLKNKWQCLCGTGNNPHKLYTIKEANEMYSVCNSKHQNHESCQNLCPKRFQYGRCNKIKEIWQCVCKQSGQALDSYTWKEATVMDTVCNQNVKSDKDCGDLCPNGFIGYCKYVEGFHACYCVQKLVKQPMPILFTIPYAESVVDACNSQVQSNEKCKKLRPPNFKIGRCIKLNEIWECRFSQHGYEHEFYSISEAKRSYQACYKARDKDGCSILCPVGFIGHCVDIVEGVRGCGCNVAVKGNEWYTVKQAHEMSSVCNIENYQTPEAKSGCFKLCTRFFSEGKCAKRLGFCECFCSVATGFNVWVTLKEAIAMTQMGSK